MVGRPGKFQPRFTSGELDALIQQNTDLHIYNMGASRMANATPLPQGGFRGRYGTLKRARLRGPLNVISYNGASWNPTAPLGGNAVALLQGLSPPLTTTGSLGVGRNIIWHNYLNDPATRHISVVDVSGYYSPSAGLVANLTVEWSLDNVTWHQIDNPHAVSASSTNRRFLGPTSADGALYWQVVLNLQPGSFGGTFVITTLAFYSQPYGANAGQLSSAVRIKPFNISPTEAYDVVFTDNMATIYASGTQVGAVPTAYAGQAISEINVKQKLDTMLIFHPSYPPMRIVHQGAPTEWYWDNVPFANVPLADFGLVYGNGIAAAWDLQFFGFETTSASYPMPSGGAHFQLTVNNEVTANILYPNPQDYLALANNLKVAIEALIAVQPGITIGTVSLPGTVIYRIYFTGVGNEGDSWAVSGKGIDKGDTAITASHAVIGVRGGEPIMSASRGWPTCGGFYAQRLLIGGFPGKPNTVVASVQDDFYNLNNTLRGAEGAMVLPLDTIGDEQVIDIHVGRNLMFFTNQAEYWMFDRLLDATTVPQIVFASKNGLARGVEPVENEAKTIYTHQSRGRLFEFGFDYPTQNYVSTDISVQSSSLVVGVVDNAIRLATLKNDINTLFVVNGDGTGLAIQLLRGQDVTAFGRYLIAATDKVLAVDVNGFFDANFCIQRLVGGQPVNFLETASTTSWLDLAETQTLGSPGTLITGLTDQEGASVWALADGYWQGPFTVTGGQITLNFPATNVLIGRWTPPDARTLPQPRDVAPKTVVRRPARVHTVRCTVVNTTSIAIGANGQPAYDVPLARFGGPVDTPLAPYTGEVVVEGILGFSKDAIVQITQMKPGAMIVTGITVEVDL